MCEESLRKFKESALARGYAVRGDTPSDGNCFFWALSDQLDQHNIAQVTHHGLRDQVATYTQNLTQVFNFYVY